MRAMKRILNFLLIFGSIATASVKEDLSIVEEFVNKQTPYVSKEYTIDKAVQIGDRFLLYMSLNNEKISLFNVSRGLKNSLCYNPVISDYLKKGVSFGYIVKNRKNYMILIDDHTCKLYKNKVEIENKIKKFTED